MGNHVLGLLDGTTIVYEDRSKSILSSLFVLPNPYWPCRGVAGKEHTMKAGEAATAIVE